MIQEIKIEKRGYGFEPENPIYIREQDLYNYILALRLDKDSNGKKLQHCSARSSFPVQAKSTESIRCIRVCFQTEIDKLETYELYFCLEGEELSKKNCLHTQIPEGFKIKAVEVLTVLAQGSAAKSAEKKHIVKSGSGEVLDELLPQALGECIEAGQASATLLRKKLEIGYRRVAKLLDQMEKVGFISAQQGPGGRMVCISNEEYKELFGCEPKSIASKK